MADHMKSGFSKAMAGATRDYKAQLRKNVDAEVYRQVCVTAVDVLAKLPKDVPVGTLTAALMLAATAYAEGAGAAVTLIEAKQAGE